MFFRGSQYYQNYKNKNISLPGNSSTCRDSAPKNVDHDFPERAASCTSERKDAEDWNKRGWHKKRWYRKRKKRRCSALFKRGSLTVEAAFSIPLFFLTVVSLVSLMGIYGEFCTKTVALQQSAEEFAILQTYIDQGSTVPVMRYDTVKVTLPFLPFDVAAGRLLAAASVLPWTGRSDYSDLEAANSSGGQLYYLSDYQSVYHTSSCCSYLSLQITALSSDRLRSQTNHSGEHYGACDKCVGAGGVGSVVYVTENGEHYHNSPECSGLKRSVHLVEEEEIAGLHMCQRCSRREHAA